MAILICLLLVAAFLDVWKGRIPNILILLGFFLGLGRLILSQKQIYAYLPGILIPPILLFPLYMIGTLGAGDIKLLSLIGIFLPAKESFICIFLAFFIGAAIGFILLLKNKNLMERMYYLYTYLLHCLQMGQVYPYYPPEDEGREMKKKSGINFAVPILISTIFVTGGVIQ